MQHEHIHVATRQKEYQHRTAWLVNQATHVPPSPTLPPLDLAMESNSSKNRTQGAACLA